MATFIIISKVSIPTGDKQAGRGGGGEWRKENLRQKIQILLACTHTHSTQTPLPHHHHHQPTHTAPVWWLILERSHRWRLQGWSPSLHCHRRLFEETSPTLLNSKTLWPGKFYLCSVMVIIILKHTFARNGATKKLVNEATEAKRYVGTCSIFCGIFRLAFYITVPHSRAHRGGID